MILYNTHNKTQQVPFAEAVFNSLPGDGGLYMPLQIPEAGPEFFQQLIGLSLPEIAFAVARKMISDIPDADLKAIIDDAINFDAPVVKLDDNTFVLELFHGPSLAFKDFGARFMSRVMAYFSKKEDALLDVLVATSGDTGGAAALGFLGVENTRVTILYPKGKVSPIQELQLTANGRNIFALEVEGTFDDCQAMVKQAFSDPELNRKLRLTSANSINIARLVPQMFYYVNAWAKLQENGPREVVFSVPSGNFGNLCAGVFAWKMGLPVKQFIAATNVNDTVPAFLQDGNYQPKPSVQTLSNAMDVGNPSNWPRIMELFGQDVNAIKDLIDSYAFTDEDTQTAIAEIFDHYNYVVCPHTAIAWLAQEKWRVKTASESTARVFLSTAHSCKFPDVFPPRIAQAVHIPEQVKELAGKTKHAEAMENDYTIFKQWLMKRG
ncbi:MAG: threonine synthase [Mucilaginibacter polytrichastri]|nr:threonine synthase [Mucilaginibacter polytrichastri]